MHDDWNVTWNDVALLTDQRACTFLCKTMLNIPMEDEIALQDITLKQWRREDTQEPNQLSGVMALTLTLCSQQGEQSQLQADIPLQGTMQTDTALGEGRLLYSRGELIDGNLLLETVLQLPCELELQSTQVIVGQFAMEELLELEENWPDCVEVLTTAAVAEVQKYAIEKQALMLEGVYQLTIVYVDDSQIGERLFAYQQKRPFTWQIAVPAGLQELSGVQPYYQSLAVQLLDSHHIQLTGTGVVCTLPVHTMMELEEQDGGDDGVCDVEPITEMPKQPMYHGPSVVNCRGSRRAKLNQYMRDLNGMGQSPTSIRNFEIANSDLEQDDDQTEDV